ncbi:adenylate/guanylate cyclase domain-containing protein [Bradyrhizobium jicamae]|uniref:Adenylate/guanylate cyclase domain-containing protein n=1 Tax=Bradyrhizobium jicamae TaxID=280332 RepID=A0ABS5FS38_9BRAD|nr:adenylate/guanylate cyclase domain-containing protein [Bradyrhizobium jicamae]MBR0799638.1 adenylate/guanylate cyclase domain-containing protein [Bradyrhizobium jicamae]
MTLLVFLAVVLLLPSNIGEQLRDSAFDLVLANDWPLRRPVTSDQKVVVIDIDRASIDALGAWPWPRATMAQLVEAVVNARPAAIAIDVLFSEPDDRSPAALARRLGSAIGQPEISKLASTLPDGDKLLAQAIDGVPVVLGFVLDPDRESALSGPSIVSRGSLPFDELWQVVGAVGPTPALAAAARGLGVLSLPGSSDGAIRQVPVFVSVGGVLMPGLAAEALRLATGASSYLIESAPPSVVVGNHRVALSRNAFLRLAPTSLRHRTRRTFSAVEVLKGRIDQGQLRHALVLLGGSAPELGGLRKTSADPLTPSVQIQADAVEQMIAGRAPSAPTSAPIAEPLTSLSIGALAVVLGAILSPAIGSSILGGAIVLLWITAIVASGLTDRLVDPLTPTIAASLVFAVTAGTAYSVTRRREALIHHRLEQHLAPAVVRRIVEQPNLVKLSGERREVTSLFTDIERFTATMHRAGPEELVETLDQYFEGVAGIVISHGGMVDKIVGDGMHALFNAPIDLQNHPQRAIECAIAIRAWSESFRRRDPAAAIRLGGTRIGIETGPAVVGDVGIQSKLDYTAHGDAVNMAARLEACNKELGSAICVGPGAAEQCNAVLLRPLGQLTVRGRNESISVFEPWPEDAPLAWREAYLKACAILTFDPARAAVLLHKLIAERPADLAIRRFVERLSSMCESNQSSE